MTEGGTKKQLYYGPLGSVNNVKILLSIVFFSGFRDNLWLYLKYGLITFAEKINCVTNIVFVIKELKIKAPEN